MLFDPQLAHVQFKVQALTVASSLSIVPGIQRHCSHPCDITAR
jgi:hypothetical protein